MSNNDFPDPEGPCIAKHSPVASSKESGVSTADRKFCTVNMVSGVR